MANRSFRVRRVQLEVSEVLPQGQLDWRKDDPRELGSVEKRRFAWPLPKDDKSGTIRED